MSSRISKCTGSIAALLAAVSALSSVRADESNPWDLDKRFGEWKTLFNGKDTTGWQTAKTNQAGGKNLGRVILRAHDVGANCLERIICAGLVHDGDNVLVKVRSSVPWWHRATFWLFVSMSESHVPW